jgi:methylenetetrahydrofolate reductase (NADPH)
MSSLAMSKLLLENGIEPVMQISCRDRNKIALQSEILGANALGIKNILCITGDSVKAGDQQDAKAVHQFESVRLLKQIQDFNKGIDPTFGELPDKKTFIYAGAAADPSCRNQKSLENRVRKKKDAGAQFIQTQMVMERENLIEFYENIAKPLEIPVIAGVFLLKSYKNALFINKNVPGAKIPENILNRLEAAKNPLEEGIQIAAEQAKDFFHIANGIHLMAVKTEHLIPEILEKADLSLEY